MTQTTGQFALTEEQAHLAESADRYAGDRLPYGAWLKRMRAGEVLDAALWQDMSDFGWLAIGIPEAHGGLGFTIKEHAALMESLGRHLLLEPYWSTAVLGAKLIEHAGAADQQARLLPAIASGSRRLAFACFEPGTHYDTSRVACAVRRQGSGALLNGRKIAVLDCGCATDLLVLARTDDCAAASGQGGGRLAVCRIDPRQAGVTAVSYRTVDGRECADLSFQDVAVNDADILVAAGDAAPAVAAALDYATVALCAEAVGIMSHLISATIDYLKTRQQFGRPLADFQVLRHRVVDMHVASEQTRSLTMMAASRMNDAPSARARVVAAAKVQAGAAGRYIGESAVQLHGGIGMTDDLAIGHYMKRLMGIDVLFGNADFQLRRFAGMTSMGTEGN